MACLIIAEMANAHEGDFENAKLIVAAAAAGGADAIKFQVFSAEELAVPDFSHFDVYRKLEMRDDQWSELVALAKEKGLKVYADVFGFAGAELMNRLGVDGFMIHAADIQNAPLLKVVGKYHKHTILSTAGSNRAEVKEALAILEAAGAPLVLLMHGFQGYPTAMIDANLRRVRSLQLEFGRAVGFANHLDGGAPEAPSMAAWAMAAGADAVEVHLTLDRSKKGLDHFSSLDPAPFAEMVRLLRAAELAMGSPVLELSTPELTYRQGHGKVLISTRDIEVGDVLREEDLSYSRINNAPADPAPSLGAAVGCRATEKIPRYSAVLERTLSS